MDGLVLIAAAALGTGLTTGLGRTDATVRQGMLVLWAVRSVLLSGAIAGPLVLLAQVVRGRRSPPTWGEWF
jgi:hypothetical protein